MSGVCEENSLYEPFLANSQSSSDSSTPILQNALENGQIAELRVLTRKLLEDQAKLEETRYRKFVSLAQQYLIICLTGCMLALNPINDPNTFPMAVVCLILLVIEFSLIIITIAKI